LLRSREFFDDGTVRKVVFYKSGKVSGDFWPDGNLKRKESTHGKHTIVEWFYPSGRLHKRFVRVKDGWVVEPVRLFHENGQLAEELNVVMKENRNQKCGPWLKFFDDGSPRLQAVCVFVGVQTSEAAPQTNVRMRDGEPRQRPRLQTPALAHRFASLPPCVPN
jgi:hypothetical protein